ncbi:MAG: hypothetical protein K5662_08805 [Lachnospiraceae bacterium]|jgi:hypothetical protein|nr:hypothetical protein [Lachnospiraceae bacterium]
MENKDYKYLIQDFSNVYIGGKTTYADLMDDDDVSFKLRTIIAHYILQEVDRDTTIENHIFFMEKDSMSYMVYKKMKALFKLNVFLPNGAGRNKPGYTIKEYSIDDIIDSEELQSKKNEIFLNEVRLKKLAIMGIVV